MPWHTVAPGEHLTAIADRFGFSDVAAIFNHADNKPLRDKKRDPHILHPGDQLFIPDKTPKEADAATGKIHTFKVKLPSLMMRVIVHGEDDQPLANKPYKLTVDGKEIEGQSGGDGMVEAPILPTTREAKLVIDGHEIPLRIGHLDPVEEDSGVLSRLVNLGYDTGGETTIGERATAAIRRFQKANGLTEDGALNDATRQKLKEKHVA